ncbi:hypothetical protein Fcan01_25655 [Folsomia candida]|uniref:Uncharacterized protein n=1 Tax=Folsomia candida TaxID=158441 RepID=A0A226D1X3_FOLCA|nr:hypothetical protein Fcan01_25655 [Folsomia candida]
MFAKWKRFGIMDKEADKIFDQIVSSTIEKRRTYCKGSSMLVCDKATEKCVCGEFNVQIGVLRAWSTQLFLEAGVRGGRSTRGQPEAGVRGGRSTRGQPEAGVRMVGRSTEAGVRKISDRIDRRIPGLEYVLRPPEAGVRDFFWRPEYTWPAGGRSTHGRLEAGIGEFRAWSTSASGGRSTRRPEYAWPAGGRSTRRPEYAWPEYAEAGGRKISDLWDNETGEKVCRWSRGAQCDFSSCTIPGRFVNQCGQILSCNSVREEGLCTGSSESDYLLYTIHNKIAPEEYRENVMMGEVCRCGDEIRRNSTSSVIGTGRIKRSLREEEGNVYEQAKAIMSPQGATN